MNRKAKYREKGAITIANLSRVDIQKLPWAV